MVGQALTSKDRCDRCGAAAVIAVSFDVEADSELLFCGHHARDHKDALMRVAVDIRDKLGRSMLSRIK